MGNNYQQTTGSILWSVRQIQESSEELLNLLDRKELYLPTLSQITTENRKKEWLTIRVLLKELLHEEKEILYTETGSPYFADHSYFLSISHTKGYVAVALNRQNPVGIDIEYISPRINKIRDRFMSAEEDANISPVHRDIHLLLHWSAKESMFKALGEENVDFKTCLHIEAFEPTLDTISSFSTYETRTEFHRRFSVYYCVQPDYIITFTSDLF